MRRRSPSLLSRSLFAALFAALALPVTGGADEVRGLSAQEARRLALAAAPIAGDPELPARIAAALAAAKSPDQPVPRPSAAAPITGESPLAARIGRDVTLVRRPGVGTPTHISGERLFEARRVETTGRAADPVDVSRAFLRENRTLLALSDPDSELGSPRLLDDPLGLAHVRYEQRYRGVLVWPAELTVHMDRNGDVTLMDGSYVPTPKIRSVVPVVSAADAAKRARREMGIGAATPGEPELIVYAPGRRLPRLAWRVETTGTPRQMAYVVIDAANGARLAVIPRVMEENVVGSGIDLFGATVPLNVWNTGATGFRLIDTSKPMYDPTSQVLDPTKTRGAIYVGDSQHLPASSTPDVSQAHPVIVSSTSSTSWTPPDAVSAAFNFGKVYDYYRDRHTRNSIDGQGGNILAIVRLGVGYKNAFWSDAIGGMFFGDFDKYAGSIDVVGHEMTHGVTSHTAGLIYQDQSGALNEALSDIFGESVENYANGSNDWIMGTRLARAFRNMSDPASQEIVAGSGRHYPSRMSEFIGAGDPLLDQFVGKDHGGVHLNSSIINRAYYLLAQGMAGAIGLRDAERIFYRTLTLHLTKSSQFLDARLAAVQSATEIFGAGSNQATQTGRAFDAVEVVAATPAPPPPTRTPSSSADSVVLIYRDTSLLLGRRETALGDPSQGSRLSTIAAANERPSVSGDGSLVFFVSATNDACFIATNGSASASCLGFPGQIGSAAMSRDQRLFAFVFVNAGVRDNQIGVIDLVTSTSQIYPLLAPATDAGSSDSVLFADTLDFSANRRYLFYDNFNVLTLADGSRIGLWSISAIDFAANQELTIVPPTPGFDVANPAVAKTSDDYLAFEAVDQTTGKSDLYTIRGSTGSIGHPITGIASGFAAPSYAGDDLALVYAYPDATAPTGQSLARVTLNPDHLTSAGNPSQWLFDGSYGVVYRRGSFSSPTGNCTQTPTSLCLSSGRFQVSATFTTTAGQQGVGQAVRLTSDTGYFTFFDPANVEVVVKVLNGCGFNQRLWVFAGGLTNVATVITVTDTATGLTRTYGNPQGTAFLPIQDTSAFSTCFTGSIAALSDTARESSRAAGEVAALAAARPLLWSPDATPSPLDRPPDGAGAPPAAAPASSPEAADTCTADPQSLCLNNGRFRVQTSFLTNTGQSGAGNAVRLTGDTGYFWFFDPNNVEMVVKALNGCGFNSRFWVFAGGLTNVRVMTTVTDTQTGVVKTYTNPLNQAFQPLQDTAAFTCP